MLVAHGADTQARNFAQRTPAEAAAANGHARVAAWLVAVAAREEPAPQAAELAAELGVAQAGGPAAKPSPGPKPPGGSDSGPLSCGLGSASGNATLCTLSAQDRAAADALLQRPWEGLGSAGCTAKPGLIWYRLVAVLLVAVWLTYLVWRAGEPTPGAWA